MLDYVIYLTLGTFEVLASYIFVFVLFCFPIKENRLYLVLASVVPILPSYVLRHAGFDGVDIMVQAFIITMFFWLMFRVPIHYSIIVMGVGYLFYGIIQFLIIYGLILLQIVSFEEIAIQNAWGYSIQISTALAVLAISYGLHKRRMHFSFIPNHAETKVRYKKREHPADFNGFGQLYGVARGDLVFC